MTYITNPNGRIEQTKYRSLVEFLKRHLLTVGTGAVVLLLAVIIALQLFSLDRIERFWGAYAQLWRQSYLSEVAGAVEAHYRQTAELAFDDSMTELSDESLKLLETRFANTKLEGVRRLFIVRWRKMEHAQYVYDPKTHKMVRSEQAAQTVAQYQAFAFDSDKNQLIEISNDTSPETTAIFAACTPWQLLSGQTTPRKSVLLTEERDPNHRIVLRTVADKSARIIGVLGFVVDENFVRERLLQPAIDEPFPKYFPGSMATNVVVSIFDRDEKPLHISPQTTEGLGDTVSYQMPFLFTDWKLQIVSRNTTPQQLARNFYRTNLLLCGLATVSILGCVGLALYSASKLMRVSQMKSEFVSNVSHELRTPLASIRVFGEFLKLGRVRDAGKMREYGDYIETESRRLTALINNILDFDKIERNRKEYKFDRTDASAVVSDVIKTFEMQSKEHGFRIVYDGPKAALPPVKLDRDALTQALMNLLDNAVKHSLDGGWREIGVRLRADKNSVKISVLDHGIGIAPEEQNKIFEKFYRVSTGLVHNVKGSGLGLAIVKHIAEAHGGAVTVESELKKGSEFTIHLPIETVQKIEEVVL